MASLGSVAAEFQRRRKATWRAIRLWLMVVAACLISMIWIALSFIGENGIKLGSLLLLLVCLLLWIIHAKVRRLYRCPRCNQVPIVTVPGWRNELGSEPKDVVWNPSECPTCYATLR